MSENGGLASAGPFAYAERGWPVFPTRGKEPLTPNGLKDATTDLSTVDRWTRTWPDAGIGLRTGAASGVVVLDVDPRHGGDDTLHELERQHGPLPNTVEAVTGGGGRHIYFKHPGEPVRNSAGKVGPGLDVRGDGGYVVLPPSPHESGRRYEWGSLPDETPLAEIPAWLLERMRGTQNGNGAASAPVVGETIAKGTQHATLVSLAGSMRRRGMGEEEIAAALRETNRRRLEDPAPEQHIDRIARSVCELYPPGAAPASQNGGAHARQSAAGRVTRASGVKALPVTWLIPQRVPVGGVTLLAGDPKLGKSTLSCLYAARLSRGVYGTPATTLFASAEDSFAHVIKPRRIAAGADLDLVAKFDVVDADGARNLDLPDDVAALDGAAAETGARLVVIDPLNAHLAGSIDSWKDHGIRRALAPLARLADERDCAVMVVAHLNKQKSGDPLYRVGGSIGNVGAARSVLAFGRDPDDPDGERGNQRLLGHLACNWGSLADTQLYELEGLAVEADGEVIDVAPDVRAGHAAGGGRRVRRARAR